jgi:hypothetical protein
MPAVEYTDDAGIDTPELKWPTTAVHFRVDELLRDERAHLRIGLVVLGHQLELDVLAADLRLLRIELVDRHLRAVLVVLAIVGLPAVRGDAKPILTTSLRGDRCGNAGRGEQRDACERIHRGPPGVNAIAPRG